MGATHSTLPLRREASPFESITIWSAWSHGTSLRRSVRLPCTVSLVMMFRFVKSANTWSSERMSMFWKFSDRRSPR
ncbi:hypothetical protein D3C86_1345570 [compost metagenome]